MFLPDWNGSQVYIDYNVDTCYLAPPLLVHTGRDMTRSELDRSVSPFLGEVVAGLNHELLGTLKNLAIFGAYGAPLWDDSNEHLSPLLEVRNLQRITWLSYVHSYSPTIDKDRLDLIHNKFWPGPNDPVAKKYWFGSVDEILPFRNDSPEEFGVFLDERFQEIKDSIDQLFRELDTNWKVPEVTAGLFMKRKKKQKQKATSANFFSMASSTSGSGGKLCIKDSTSNHDRRLGEMAGISFAELRIEKHLEFADG